MESNAQKELTEMTLKVKQLQNDIKVVSFILGICWIIINAENVAITLPSFYNIIGISSCKKKKIKYFYCS